MTKIEPAVITFRLNADGVSKAAASIVYGSGLFRSKFTLKPDGMIEMLEDSEIPTPEGLIQPERWNGPFRRAGYD